MKKRFRHWELDDRHSSDWGDAYWRGPCGALDSPGQGPECDLRELQSRLKQHQFLLQPPACCTSILENGVSHVAAIRWDTGAAPRVDRLLCSCVCCRDES